MAVRAELVKEFLVDRLVGEVEERYPGEIAAAPARALEAVVEAPWVGARSETTSQEVLELAAGLARKGYLSRLVETELFGPARSATPGLGEMLSGRVASVGEDWVDAVIALSGELAGSEPLGRPDPDQERSLSWRVPGPGGHVRHYVALETVALTVPKGPGGQAAIPGGIEKRALKQCWFYGFYVRCCEEALPPGSDSAPPER